MASAALGAGGEGVAFGAEVGIQVGIDRTGNMTVFKHRPPGKRLGQVKTAIKHHERPAVGL